MFGQKNEICTLLLFTVLRTSLAELHGIWCVSCLFDRHKFWCFLFCTNQAKQKQGQKVECVVQTGGVCGRTVQMCVSRACWSESVWFGLVVCVEEQSRRVCPGPAGLKVWFGLVVCVQGLPVWKCVVWTEGVCPGPAGLKVCGLDWRCLWKNSPEVCVQGLLVWKPVAWCVFRACWSESL